MESKENPKTKTQPSKQKLKILCLHGLLQNSSILERKLLEIIKTISQYYEVETIIPNGHISISSEDYIDIMGLDSSDDKQIDKRGWYFFNEDKTKYWGLEKTIEDMVDISNTHKDINLIFGFSQGGTIAILMSIYKVIKHEYNHIFPGLKGLILCSTSLRSRPINKEYEEISGLYLNKVMEGIDINDQIDIPSLHIYGEEDEIVSPEYSILSSKIFKNSVLYSHPGKHFIPKRSVDKKEILNFIRKLMI